MNSESLIDHLIEHEGLKLKPYTDTMGKLTIGIGRNLTDLGISEVEARMLCANDVARLMAELDRNVPWWRSLDETRQEVLAEMCFNLGWPRLSQFHAMLESLKSGDAARAAEEMLKSAWATQVGQRAHILALAMKSGTF
jgi:lysozyme